MVRALCTTRWNYFTRTGGDILDLRELIIAYLDSHASVAEKLTEEGIDLTVVFEQLHLTVQFMREVFETEI
jgi:hypothetical protein